MIKYIKTFFTFIAFLFACLHVFITWHVIPYLSNLLHPERRKDHFLR